MWNLRPTREGNTIVIATRGVALPAREELAARADAIESRFALPALVLVTVTLFIVINLAVDVLYSALDPGKETVVYCQSGVRASETAVVLRELGFSKVKVYEPSWLGYAGVLSAPANNEVFVNVGMTMGIAPVTGIPLPFVTVGGSSMVANLLAVGVLQSIHARGRYEGAR